MGNMEASRGRFSFLADAIYTKFSGADDVLGERNPIGNLTVNARGRVGLDYELGIYQAGALFEVASLPSPRSRTTFEFGGGARWVTQEVNVNLALDVTATRNIDQRVDRLEDRIQRIDNEEERLETLEHFNELRQEILKRRIVSAKSARILKRRVDRLETRLARVERRGEIIEALEELEALRVDLLDRRIALADRDIHGNFAMARSGQMDWVDPVVAARVTHQFGNGQSLALLGDIGGFNASSDLTWQVLLSYQKDGKLFGWDTTTILGYRALGLLFEETTQHGTRGVDVVLHGPFAELAFRW